ncbi:Right handed beta helix region [Rhizobiales bacterium GAS113]|nr:Right handed beta helix region [Rhizobiales bacterium GAS113]
MRKIVLSFVVLSSALLPELWVTSAHAQATRTWVSGVGDDANPCSRTAPCKTFAGAISKTAVSGEINCLDPGGFGGVTITKSITLDCHEVFGSILVSGTNGITINAAGGSVTLRNLNIDGIQTGLSGVSIIAASRVNIEDMMIMGFTQQGIADTRTGGGTMLFIRNTVIRNTTGAGVSAAGGATNAVVIDRLHSVANGFGIAAGNGNNVIVRGSVLSGNATAGVEADPGAQVFVDTSIVTHNNIGIQPAGTVMLANTDIAFNNTAISSTTTSFGNNRIFGNVTPGTAPTVGAASSDHGQQ